MVLGSLSIIISESESSFVKSRFTWIWFFWGGIIGNSNNVLNNPLNSLRWLLNTLSKQKKYLKKGTYVSTGTCTSEIPVSKNDFVIADFDSLGIVELQLK